MSGFGDNAHHISDYLVGSLDHDYLYYSGIDRSDRHSSYGGYDSHSEHCCPLVVDTVCLAGLLLSIAGATVFLARVFQIELTGRRRRRSLPHKAVVLKGKPSCFSKYAFVGRALAPPCGVHVYSRGRRRVPLMRACRTRLTDPPTDRPRPTDHLFCANGRPRRCSPFGQTPSSAARPVP